MTAAASQRLRPSLVPYLAVSAAVCAFAAALASHATDARAALYGVGAAAVAACLALPALALGSPRGTNGLLAGFVAGFLVRLIAVAAGLIASEAQGAAALTYAMAFFGVYAVTQAVEVAYVFGSSRTRRAGA
ncbi:MAG TPA: hypothetical protein VG496_12565 [Myxococcales bacterium]|nr:hypothetical protein [Myxococcales bacterium]